MPQHMSYVHYLMRKHIFQSYLLSSQLKRWGFLFGDSKCSDEELPSSVCREKDCMKERFAIFTLVILSQAVCLQHNDEQSA